ncbi:serine hydrolase [Brevibacillus sp. SYP-B805]|uniref:serine hydrolase n=1 Tax=Brevibacillus sp. SYP-B805 TaxID=1578199 RepID=UPI0013ECF7AF|nr:serine hydrolase [Brevibacillus sp. SYP-B805]NGQ94186.1 serine hydrolase [Brevibacillus sp. SYP-B805]
MLGTLHDRIMALVEKAGGTWGIVLEDVHTNERWTLNEDHRFFAASLIKVPIMTAVFAEAYAGKFAFEDKLKLRQEDLVGGSGVLQHMTPGTELTILDLVTLMIIQSDNTATNLLIDLVGKESIREIMRKTGMTNSQFYNKLMIIPAELEGYNEVTAADMARHLKLLATGKAISYDSCLRMIAILKKQQVRDSLPYHLPDPDADIIGGLPLWELANKTGSVSTNEHDCGILYVGQSAVIIAALSHQVPTKTARDTIGRIGELVYNLYRNGR